MVQQAGKALVIMVVIIIHGDGIPRYPSRRFENPQDGDGIALSMANYGDGCSICTQNRLRCQTLIIGATHSFNKESLK